MTTPPWVALAEICARERYALAGGPFGSKLVRSDYVDVDVPVIRGTNLPNDHRFSLEDFVFATEEKASADLFGNLAHPGDIVVTQRGTLGQVGLIPLESPFDRFVISQSQMKLTVDTQRANAESCSMHSGLQRGSTKFAVAQLLRVCLT